jgi:hypothetical protein
VIIANPESAEEVTFVKLRACLLAILSILSFTWIISVPPASAGDPPNFIVSNINDNSFVATWTTAESEIGQVQLINGATFHDDRGEQFSGKTHYVTVGGLSPETAYQFDVVSGGNKYDRTGIHYSVMVGARLDPPIPDQIIGQANNPDGSSATEAIIFFTIQSPRGVSSPLSMLLREHDAGVFHVNLSDARVMSDPTHYLSYSQDDQVTIQAINPFGLGMLALTINDPRLRAIDPKQMAVVVMREIAVSPTIVAQPVTPTPRPATNQSVSGDSLMLIGIGIGIAGLVMIGVLAIAVTFVWKR